MEPMKYYNATVTATGLNEKEGKSMAIVIEAQTEDGETGTAYLYCSDKAWPYTEEKLSALGWDPAQNGYRFEELNGDGSPLIGAPCRMRMKLEMYEGKEQRKYDIFAGGPVRTLDQSEARSFGDRLRAQVLGGGGGNGAWQQAPAPIDEEPPF